MILKKECMQGVPCEDQTQLSHHGLYNKPLFHEEHP